jgi:hypothetical protein
MSAHFRQIVRMDDAARNQDIVTRRLAGDSLATIGKGCAPKISRQRVQQIWNETATKADKSRLAEITAKPERVAAGPRVPIKAMVRLHVLMDHKTTLTSEEIRQAIAKWLAGGKIEMNPDAQLSERMDLYMPIEMKNALATMCEREGISKGVAMSAITRTMENAK